MQTETALAQKFAVLLPHLNEKQRRLVVAAEACALGRGGVTRAARASGLSRPTITKAVRELEQPATPMERVRQVGGGRKKSGDRDPALRADLEALVSPATRGDPQSPLRWTVTSTRQLAVALQERGHQVSHVVVAALLREADYSLQANVKTREGAQHPDRDAQFTYLNAQVSSFLEQDLPVLSVDTKKKELVGAFKTAGQTWRPQGQPEQVTVHDFVDPARGKAIPYGIYDVGQDAGWVTVGCDHDTASFAVASLRRWWQVVGARRYPGAGQVLICADSGGSNGPRVRLWKVELQHFVNETGVQVTVCHLPPGTSKWNTIEHRLFSHISMNWRGRPLISHEVIVDLIGATTTRTGLHVQAELDTGVYPTRVAIAEAELDAVHLTPHRFHGEWNYTITPGPPQEES